MGSELGHSHTHRRWGVGMSSIACVKPGATRSLWRWMPWRVTATKMVTVCTKSTEMMSSMHAGGPDGKSCGADTANHGWCVRKMSSDKY
eukprot:6931779-Heterocapsa_arctica.AAC.1